MSPALVDIASQEDHVPPCLFPTSSFSPSEGRIAELASEELLLEKDLDAVRPALSDSQIELPIALQTAWALTLRCFVPSDILCFAYNDGTEAPLVLIGRVDNTETLAVCLQRFKEQTLAPTLGAPSGY